MQMLVMYLADYRFWGILDCACGTRSCLLYML